MKKFIMFIALMISVVMSANAHVVSTNRVFDNTYAGFSAGGSAWLDNTVLGSKTFIKGVRPVFTLRTGKYFTPVVGVELLGEAGLNDTPAHSVTFFDHSYVGLNGLVNLNNLFAGYRGNPDRVEVVLTTGSGWYHGYVAGDGDFNGWAVKHGLQLNWNLGSAKAWQINFMPGITYIIAGNTTGAAAGLPVQYNKNRAYVDLQIGFTYKFRNADGSHNFTLCDKQYTQAEWDALNAQVNELRNALKAVPAQEVVTNTVTVVEKVVDVQTQYVLPKIQFVQNGYVIAPTSQAAVAQIADFIKDHQDLTFNVVGYASEEGSADYNKTLSQKRADVVKVALVALGVNPAQLSATGAGATTQFGQSLPANRVVVVCNR